MARRPVLTGAVIAADARRYTGKGYVYGGNASAAGDWDCSSFVSWVLGRDLRLDLPGGRYGDAGFPPHAHGPVVTDYARWAGASTVHTPAAGDLCVWAGEGPNGHIGIAVSGTEMVSALNPQMGTVRTPIQGYGPAGAPLTYRRVSGTVTQSVARAAGYKAPHGAVQVVEELAVVGVVAAGALVAGWVLVSVAGPVVAWSMSKAIRGALKR